ncbi:MAG: MgtC/SapB family protein [Rhizobiales bacterium]|nr:MgtC/SapB family protein [Hyphomicrobiales bacterium]
MDFNFFQELDLVRRLAVATLIGLLIGIERGWRERNAHGGTRTAGIRTFTLIGLLGGIIGLSARAFEDKIAGAVLVAVVFAVFAVLFAWYRMRENIADKNFGFTTVVAAMATFGLGVYSLLGNANISAAIGVAMMVILVTREPLHGLLEKVTWPELRAAVILLAMTFLALPFIPDQSFGPYGGVNPRQVWLLAVILAAVSFLGYVAVKTLGRREGTLISSAAGGLVSSTAVTLAASRVAAADKNGLRFHAASVAIATAISLAKTLLLVYALNRAAGLMVAAPLAGGSLAALTAGLLFVLGGSKKRAKESFELRNPFSLRETLMLAALIGAVTFAVQVFSAWFGTAGGLITALISGSVDADAAAVSLARLGAGSISPAVAALGIVLAVSANNIFKFFIGVGAAGRPFAPYLLAAIGIPVAVMLVVAAGVLLFLGGVEALSVKPV